MQKSEILVDVDGKKLPCKIERKRVKRQTLKIDENGNLSVSVPLLTPEETIQKFVCSHINFIRKNLSKIAKRTVRPDEVIVFGKKKKLVVVENNSKGVIESENSVTVNVTKCDDVEIKRVLYGYLNKKLEIEILNECKKFYPYFLKVVAYPKIRFSNMKSRYGTCNYVKNVLTFSYMLINAEIEAIEYVVVHEFCHFIEHNHSANFYKEVEKVLPDYKERKKLLRNHLIENK